MTRFNALLGPNKFPVPMRRELARKSLNLALDSEPTIHSGGPLLAGNIQGILFAGGSETSSLKTASSTGESGTNLTSSPWRAGQRGVVGGGSFTGRTKAACNTICVPEPD